ncbi:hypothetical protein Hanom_Chr12g01112651 [Helianthus anomalus]
MGYGLGVSWGKTHTTPELGFGRGPWGLGLKLGVGRASKVTWRTLNGQTKLAISHSPMCQFMPPTQVPPYPTGVGLGLFSMYQLIPQPKSQPKSQPKPTIPQRRV